MYLNMYNDLHDLKAFTDYTLSIGGIWSVVALYAVYPSDLDDDPKLIVRPWKRYSGK